jgi:hypothetical protein
LHCDNIGNYIDNIHDGNDWIRYDRTGITDVGPIHGFPGSKRAG